MIRPEEAIDQLERLRNPEPWDPVLTDTAYEALSMGIEAIKVMERLQEIIRKMEDKGC
jgi:hypothetical protein